MIKYLLVFFTIISFVPKSTSQTSLNDYSFVVIPEQFSFLDSEDEYRLNSLTKFLFNKYGFHAFFGNELPIVDRCEGLWAEVDGNSGIIYTKMTIILKDCNNQEIYRTPVGRSKLKEYNKTYQDALRKAFNSIITMGVQQKEMMVFDAAPVPNKPVVEAPPTPAKPVIKEEIIKEVPTVATATVSKLGAPPASKFSNYLHRGQTYLLMKTAEGYDLYEESADSENGLLLLGKISIEANSEVNFKDTLDQKFKANFDEAGHFIIEKGGQLLYYKLLKN